ncbi:hypothetical protein AHAS_Ahas18G0172600 [Arachis hypogaea]
MLYPQRYLCHLKQYVRNRSQQEGSIAEEYLSEEILVFCSSYLDNVESRINQPMCVDDQPRDLMPDECATMSPEVSLGSIIHPNELQWLACGPNVQASHFTSYNHDSNVVGSISYYEKIVDIIELNYSGQFIVFLFRYIWTNTTSGRGIRQDSLGHTLVNFSHPIHTGDREDDEPYILATEARLVYYVDDEVDQE